jgi:hypothetical protein
LWPCAVSRYQHLPIQSRDIYACIGEAPVHCSRATMSYSLVSTKFPECIVTWWMPCGTSKPLCRSIAADVCWGARAVYIVRMYALFLIQRMINDGPDDGPPVAPFQVSHLSQEWSLGRPSEWQSIEP